MLVYIFIVICVVISGSKEWVESGWKYNMFRDARKSDNRDAKDRKFNDHFPL